MPDVKISALPASTTPLAGTEVLPIVQSATTRQVSVANLTAGRAVSALSIATTTGANFATTSGSVGIGTSSPTGKLTVNTSVNSEGVIRIGDNATYYGELSRINPTDEVRLGSYGASQNLTFYTVASERMRIDASGNVGIGTTTPAAKLDVSGGFLRINEDGVGTKVITIRSNFAGIDPAINVTTNNALLFQTNNTERMRIDASGNLGLGVTPSASTIVQFEGGSNFILAGRGNVYIGNNVTFNSSFKYIATAAAAQYNISGAEHRWLNAPSGTAGNAVSFTQAMTLDASGNLLVGTTSLSNRLSVVAPSGQYVARFGLNGTGSQSFINFVIGEDTSPTGVGSITYNGSLTLYNTTSDQRLKENIVDAPSGNIDDIKVRSFDWKSDGSHVNYGFIAQELIEVAPYAVHQPKNPEEMMAVDYSKLVPMMIKEIQGLKQRIATLENK